MAPTNPTALIKTLILRFRDLSEPNTIEQHKEICNRLGFTWWGWWAKTQEKVPLYEFGRIQELSQGEDGVEILLVDSGKKLLYTAKCCDVQFSTNNNSISSPEKEHTPNYYSGTPYPAWFKLKEISDPLPNGEALKRLRTYSYFKVDALFRSGFSPFLPFYGKRVYSVDELADQQRTVWFVRDYKPGDKSHEIHSYLSSLDGDKNIDQVFQILKNDKMLWLSDLHFSDKYHAFIETAGNTNTLHIRLEEELKRKGIPSLSHIILSGDLTFTASKNEYERADIFIRDMNSVYSLNETNYSICPGNHDLKYSDEPYKPDDKVTVAFEESKECYTEFYRKLYGADPTEFLFSIRRVLTPNMIPVEIISVNSCLLQQDEDHFKGMGFVGMDQIREVEKALASTSGDKTFRILVMHHHLVPVMFSEEPKVSEMYSLTLDSEAISQFILRNNIRLVLHGHAHKAFYSEIIRFTKDSEQTKKKYYIVGIGSAGVIKKKLNDGAPNMFGVLSFSNDDLEIKQYSLYANGDESTELASYTIPYRESV